MLIIQVSFKVAKRHPCSCSDDSKVPALGGTWSIIVVADVAQFCLVRWCCAVDWLEVTSEVGGQ